MKVELEMPKLFEEEIREYVRSTINDMLSNLNVHSNQKEWMSIKEASEYAGVSFNTFKKFREMGLKVCEIDGVKRVSKTEIDKFLENNSF